ncbi:MAG: AAA family ATPase [Rhodothermales bacterium]
MRRLDHIEIEGFKSIERLRLQLGPVNVLVGQNGAGKSNFISFFRMLNELIEERLQLYVARSGGANALLYYGAKTTPEITARMFFGRNGYLIRLAPTEDDGLLFAGEQLYFKGALGESRRPFIAGHREAKVNEAYRLDPSGIPGYVVPSIRSWHVYHFHDTGPQAPPKQTNDLHDNDRLRSDAGNLAAFLYLLQERHAANYALIRSAVRQVFPRFDDFTLRPNPLNPDTIRLEWRERESDYRFGPHQLSDGTLRFICLATLLLQPKLPSTVLIDEPELGLHPSALGVLASLVRSASARAQIIMTTQSVTLLNEFEPEQVITVDRIEGASEFKRLTSGELEAWLERYTLGEIWEKNVVGARP